MKKFNENNYIKLNIRLGHFMNIIFSNSTVKTFSDKVCFALYMYIVLDKKFDREIKSAALNIPVRLILFLIMFHCVLVPNLCL